MKRILIVSVYFPPCALIGAKRPHKMAKYLSELGWHVTVLTVDPELTPHKSVDFEEIAGIEIIKTKAFVPLELLRRLFRVRRSRVSDRQVTSGDLNRGGSGSSGSVHGMLSNLARKSLLYLHFLDEWSGWTRSALRAMKSTGAEFDIVLSTIPPNSTAYLGKKLAEYFNCKYVLDYRDPWSEMIRLKNLQGKVSDSMYWRSANMEDACLSAADLVITVSPGISKMLSKRVGCRILTVPQGFSGDIQRGCPDQRDKYILYAGSLAYGRDLSFVLTCLKSYASKYGEHIKLAYFGPHEAQAIEQSNSVLANNFIDVRGQRPEDEVVEFARRSLCNLVIVSRGYEYSYPGKLFDLLTAGRPIYVLSAAQSEAGKLVVDYSAGISIVGKNLDKFVSRLRMDGSQEYSVPDEVNQLSVENIYSRLVEDGLNKL